MKKKLSILLICITMSLFFHSTADAMTYNEYIRSHWLLIAILSPEAKDDYLNTMYSNNTLNYTECMYLDNMYNSFYSNKTLNQVLRQPWKY